MPCSGCSALHGVNPNLLEYSSNYSDTLGSLWFDFKDEAINFNSGIINTDDFKSSIKPNYQETQSLILIQMKQMEF